LPIAIGFSFCHFRMSLSHNWGKAVLVILSEAKNLDLYLYRDSSLAPLVQNDRIDSRSKHSGMTVIIILQKASS